MSYEFTADRVKRVLITGGSGFIGTNAVTEFLKSGWSVLSTDVSAPKNPGHSTYWKRVDIMDRAALERAFTSFRPTLTVHLAARTDLDEQKDLSGYAANIQGVTNLIEAIVAAGSVQRSFFASSRLVCRLGYEPKHDRDYHPSTLYGQSKAQGEELVREAASSLGTWTILRPTGIWGPWFGVPYYDFFTTIRRGLYVHPAGHDVYKSFGYVENTTYQLQALVSASEADVRGRTFWLADYPPIEVRAWARLIQKSLGARPIHSLPVPLLRAAGVLGDAFERLSGRHAPLTSFRVNNMVSDMLYDTDPLKALVGPLPFSLAEGVKRTVAWLQRTEGRSSRVSQSSGY